MKRLFWLGFWSCWSLTLAAQTNEGTDFWMGFMQHINTGENSKVLMITAKESTSGMVEVPLLGFSESFSVQANEVTLIPLPQYTETVGSENVSLTGVHITANAPVSVYAHQYFQLRSEAAMILPTSSLGQHYYAMSYQGYSDPRNGQDYPSEFLAVAVEDETVLTITVADRTLGGRNAGSTFTVTLDQGETYQIQGDGGTGVDLSGSEVVGDKPFAFFAGARWTQVPSTCFARDNLFEQMYPVETWGKRFILAKNPKVDFDLIRLMAAEDNTVIYRNNSVLTTLNQGEITSFNLSSSSMYLESTKGILIAQFNVGSSCNGIGNQTGDPSMVLLNSIEQTRDTVTLYSSSFEQISENHINLIVRTDDIASVTLDGNPVSGFSEVVANPDYSVAGVQVSSGSHTLIASGCGLIASATGYGELESYAYSAGASFKNINVNPIPVGGCLNDTLQFDTGLPEGRGLAIWDFGDGSGSVDLAPPHIYTDLGTYRVRLFVTDLCLGTEDTLEQDLIVSLRQQVEASGDTLVCEGSEVSLFASDLPGASYSWIGPNGYYSEEQFPIIPDIPAANSGTYEVVGSISGCATYPNAALVEVNPTPAPYLGEDTTICGEKTFLLEPGDFASYRWQNGSGTSTFLVSGPGDYGVEVQDDLGCSGSDSLQVLEYCPPVLFVPTAFSPNQDGFNDQMTYRASFMTRFQFQVFNRWGQIIFDTTDPESYWDGNTPGQGKAPEGVYVWKANFDYQGLDGFTYVRRQSGTVTLIR